MTARESIQRTPPLQTSQLDPAPLCVDLDGTLIRSDVIWESLARLASTRPWLLPSVAVRVLGGKARFKSHLALLTRLDPRSLPYRDELLAYLQQAAQGGRRLVLATASNARVAEAVAQHLGIFEDVLGSDEERNLGGDAKREELVRRYGQRGFDYIGDRWADLPIWRACRRALLVAPSRRLQAEVTRSTDVERIFSADAPGLTALGRAVRPHQWAKNSLLFVPLVTAHLIGDAHAVLAVLTGFLAFCAVASAAYLINDIHDLPADRVNPHKSKRPIAAGLLSIPRALLACTALLALGVWAAHAVSAAFLLCLLLYFGLTLAYSFDLKRRLLVDALTLAALYTIRIVAGAVAIKVVVSEWLLMFSLFLFSSLAFLKRFTELRRWALDSPEPVPGRGYVNVDLAVLRSIGPALGCMSVLVLALYVNSPGVRNLYLEPRFLWLLCPIAIYWIARIWFLAERGLVDEDPVEFSLKDGRSHLVILAAGLVLALATFVRPVGY